MIKIAFKKYYDNSIEMICTNSLKRCCYLIFADIIVNYKEQIFIIKIKANMQYFVCHIFLQKQENLTKTWPLQIHKSI